MNDDIKNKTVNVSPFSVFLILVIPTYLLSRGIYFFSYVKISPIAYLIMLVIFLFILLSKWNLKFGIKLDPYYYFTILVAYSTITLLWAKYDTSYYDYAHLLANYMFVLLFINMVTSQRRIRAVKIITVVTFLIIIFHTILDHYVFKVWELLYPDANKLTNLFAMFSPFIISGLIEKNTKKRIILITILSLVFISFIITGSRLNMIGFFLQSSLFVMLVLLKSNIKHKKILITSALILILSAAVAVFPFFLATEGKDIGAQTSTPWSSASQRFYLITEAWRLFSESNFMGKGIGNVRIIAYWQGYAEIDYKLHNFYMHMLATWGIIGFFSFIYMYLKLFNNYMYLRKYESIRSVYIFNTGFILFLLTFPIIAITDANVFEYRPFYYIFAFVFSYLILVRREVDESKIILK